MKTLLAALLVAPLLSVSASAAEVRILSAGAAEAAMEAFAQLVKRENGDEIGVTRLRSAFLFVISAKPRS